MNTPIAPATSPITLPISALRRVSSIASLIALLLDWRMPMRSGEPPPAAGSGFAKQTSRPAGPAKPLLPARRADRARVDRRTLRRRHRAVARADQVAGHLGAHRLELDPARRRLVVGEGFLDLSVALLHFVEELAVGEDVEAVFLDRRDHRLAGVVGIDRPAHRLPQVLEELRRVFLVDARIVLGQ